MNDKVYSKFQQNLTTWTLLVVILILAGVAVLLRPPANPAPNAAATPAASPAVAPAPAVAEAAPPAPGWLSTSELILAVQVAIGAGFLGYFIGYKRGQRSTLEKIQQSITDAPRGASNGNGTNRDSTTYL